MLCDLRFYFLNKPKIKTLIEYRSPAERENYGQRILQRLGVSVSEYSVLNIHKIGIEVPVEFVFEELLHWDGHSAYWPNKLARVKRINGNLENVLIYFMGISKIRLKWLLKKNIEIKPLFNMSALKFQHTKLQSDTDNARYLLYKCSGGYPIGIFTLYVRNPMVDRNEKEETQLFSMVAFNFYGEKNWFYSNVFNPIWEKIHNRVTGNILNRIKQEFEHKFNTKTT